MPVCSVFRRIQSRRGGGGVERGGDACIAQPGKRAPTRGDASIPRPYATGDDHPINLPLRDGRRTCSTWRATLAFVRGMDRTSARTSHHR